MQHDLHAQLIIWYLQGRDDLDISEMEGRFFGWNVMSQLKMLPRGFNGKTNIC